MTRYEYKTFKMRDQRGTGQKRGTLDADEFNKELNALGAEGWHVVVSYPNSITVGNRQYSEHIVILERPIE